LHKTLELLQCRAEIVVGKICGMFWNPQTLAALAAAVPQCRI